MWPRILNALLGIWLMAAPAVLAYGAPAETNDRIVGPVAASVAIIAIWQVMRELRRVNFILGLWLLLAPWLLGYGHWVPIANDTVTGVLMIGLAQIQGTIDQRFGGGWSALWK